MRLNMFGKFKCPDCGCHLLTVNTTETIEDDVIHGEIRCSQCSAAFAIRQGIPILMPTSFYNESKIPQAPELSRQKVDQIAHFDHIGLTELEICRPHGLGKIYNYLIEKKIQTVLSLWGQSLKYKQVIDICCGSGMDMEYLYRAGANVLGVDISFGALLGAQERARRYGLDYDLLVADSENLPLVDHSFDAAFVHDGLHHLENPEKGFMEMARIAHDGVLITEPAQSAATRFAVLLGVAEAVEESGNQVHRFTPRELEQYTAKSGLVSITKKRYFMYYQQKPLPIFKWFEFNQLLYCSLSYITPSII